MLNFWGTQYGRHPDGKGAVMQNLSDVPLDSLTGLSHLICKAFHSNAAQRARKREGPKGHVLATVKVWQNGAQLDLGNLAKRTTILLADLASGDSKDSRNTRRTPGTRGAWHLSENPCGVFGESCEDCCYRKTIVALRANLAFTTTSRFTK